jgi:hypothetical protein
LPVLNQGAFGTAVEHVQHMLNDFDRFTEAQTLLNEDGELDNLTMKRINRFQEENGILPPGGVGFRTWKALLQAWLPIEQPD